MKGKILQLSFISLFLLVGLVSGQINYNNPTMQIGWCNLQWPPSGNITQGSNFTVYSRIWVDTVTPGPGPGSGIEAWIGYSTANTNPSTWTNWIPATYNMDYGNDDEYMAEIGSSLPVGTYYYASRFRRNGGPFYYGGYNATGGGFWDGTTNVSGVLVVNPPALSGDYYIPKGIHPKGFDNLASAFLALNNEGASGHVRFLIDDNLTENGSSLVLRRNDLDSSRTLTIKPAAGKTPTITIINCASSTAPDTAARNAGLTLAGSHWVTIDGSNTVGGTTRDLTIALSDSTNGRHVIHVFGNTDNVIIKNIKVIYARGITGTSGNGIFVNGQSSGSLLGVSDNLIIENSQVGEDREDLLAPFFAISFTGASTATIHCTNGQIINNDLYGRIRGINLFWANSSTSILNVSNNRVKVLNAPSGFAIWGILQQQYAGTSNFYGNVIQTMRQTTSGTQGIYGFGTLSGQANAVINLYNNFLGGDFTHTGAGTPGSIDVISFQDAVTGGTANVFHNTVVMNNIVKNPTTRITAIRQAGTWNKYLRNNVLVNLKTGSTVSYVILMGDTTGIIQFDNNVYYAADTINGFLGFWKTGVTAKNLSRWNAISGQDFNSFYENPPFAGALDFHIPDGSVTNLESGGVPIPWITVDIDGQPRSLTTPDIGADEFNGVKPGLQQDTVYFTTNKWWNIVSVPVQATNMSKVALFPHAISNAFWFDGQNYTISDTLAMGRGYWLKFDTTRSNMIVGLKRDSLIIPVFAGWNLIGTLDVNIPAGNVTSTPPNIIASQFFGFTTKYHSTTTLEKGKGYWIKTSASGTLRLRKTLAKGDPAEIFVETIDPKWRVIIISDAQNLSQELYLADNFDETRYSLPPLPPSSTFDVRFESDRYVELDNYPQIISLQGVKYPVQLVIRNAEKGFYRVKDGLGGQLLNVVLKNGQPVTINNPAITSLIIEGATIPAKFELMQNYPNPFNPTTTVRYALAEPVKVKLVVYNSVGEKVTELVNADQEAGYYSVEFNASSLASGVYLIRLETPKYVKTIKSLLIK